jgi:hypothetical protein
MLSPSAFLRPFLLPTANVIQTQVKTKSRAKETSEDKNYIFLFSLKFLVRHNNKTRIYGFEEGHDLKNEVRKDKWIKRRKLQMTGVRWRRDNELPPNAFTTFALARQPDWSFKDGTPGYLVRTRRRIHVQSDF